MVKSVEIRRAKNGFVIAAKRGPLLRFTNASHHDVGAALNHGDLCAIQESGELSVVDLPDAEHIAANLDEALTIARSIMEA